MAKLAVVALLGMLALAAALDAETQGKKGYEEYEKKDKEYEKKEYKDYKETGVTLWSSKANVEAKHQVWDLLEDTGATHPCDEQYEIFGSTVAQESTLLNNKDPVGSVTWSGVVVKHELCGDCRDYKTAGPHHIVKVNYETVFEFTSMHKGQLVAAGVAGSIFSQEETTLAVVGGTGAFEGAWGTVTWTYGTPNKYTFDVYLPSIVEVKEVKDVKAVKVVEKEEKKEYEHDKPEHEYYPHKEHEYERPRY